MLRHTYFQVPCGLLEMHFPSLSQISTQNVYTNSYTRNTPENYLAHCLRKLKGLSLAFLWKGFIAEYTELSQRLISVTNSRKLHGVTYTTIPLEETCFILEGPTALGRLNRFRRIWYRTVFETFFAISGPKRLVTPVNGGLISKKYTSFASFPGHSFSTFQQIIAVVKSLPWKKITIYIRLWSQRAPNSTEAQKELKWPKSDSKVPSQGPIPEWPQSDLTLNSLESKGKCSKMKGAPRRERHNKEGYMLQTARSRRGKTKPKKKHQKEGQCWKMVRSPSGIDIFKREWKFAASPASSCNSDSSLRILFGVVFRR